MSNQDNQISPVNFNYLEEFFYDHLENIRDKYQAFIPSNQANFISKQVQESIKEIEEDIILLTTQEKKKGLTIQEKKELISQWEGDLHKHYCSANKEDDLVGFLREFTSE